MAPPPIHEAPHVQLRRLAVAARGRGLSFEEFWTEAVREQASLVMTNHPDPPVGAVRWPTDRNDRKAWQGAIYGSRDGWRRAYEGLPAPAEEGALGILADGFAAMDEVACEREADELDRGLSTRERLPSAA